MTTIDDAAILDKRRHDFSIIDDEVVDDPRLLGAKGRDARAAYLGLVRLGRKTSVVREGMRRIAIASGFTVDERRPLRAALELLHAKGLIRAEWNPDGVRGPDGRRTHTFTILPVPKARAPLPYGRGSSSPTGRGEPAPHPSPSTGRGHPHQRGAGTPLHGGAGTPSPLVSSETLRTGDFGPLPRCRKCGGEADPMGRRRCCPYPTLPAADQARLRRIADAMRAVEREEPELPGLTSTTRR